jgi:hypothetical protein
MSPADLGLRPLTWDFAREIGRIVELAPTWRPRGVFGTGPQGERHEEVLLVVVLWHESVEVHFDKPPCIAAGCLDDHDVAEDCGELGGKRAVHRNRAP